MLEEGSLVGRLEDSAADANPNVISSVKKKSQSQLCAATSQLLQFVLCAFIITLIVYASIKYMNIVFLKCSFGWK